MNITHRQIDAKFYNMALKEIPLEEIKNYGLRPIGGGVVWWMAPLISSLVSARVSDAGKETPGISTPPATNFKQADNFQMPTNIYGQPSEDSGGGLSSNLMGDYNSKPKYGPQGGANPWQEQLWGQLFQQTDTSRTKNEPSGMKGGK